MIKNRPLAVVTGASTGLGKHMSIMLSKNNYDLVIISRNKTKLNKVKEIIKKNNVNCISIASDISNSKSIEIIFKKIKNPEKIDILINNAGIGVFNEISNVSIEEWDQQLNTNLRAPFLMTKMVVETMKKNKSGKIVFINSVAGLQPYPFSSAYVASKYGLRGFASSLREELREHRIKVISVHPGAINTPFWNNVNAKFPRDEMLQTKDVSKTIINSILSPSNLVCEEIIIRRTEGDF